MNLSYIKFDRISKNKVIVSKSHIMTVNLTSKDKELEGKEDINIHDLKYYEFDIDDMGPFDITFSLTNQVSIPIRFLRKLGLNEVTLLEIAISDIGEDFYRFINDELKTPIISSVDVTSLCEKFLNRLDGLNLIPRKDINSCADQYIGNMMCHYNEEKLRRQYSESAQDQFDKQFVGEVLALMELGPEAKLKEGEFYKNLRSQRNEFLYLMKADLTGSAQNVLNQLPNELRVNRQAATSHVNVSSRLTMLSKALINYFGHKTAPMNILIDTTKLNFWQANYVIRGLHSLHADLYDRLVLNEMQISVPDCHDFIILIKALQYGYMHNLCNVDYCLLPQVEMMVDRRDEAIVKLRIKLDDKEVIVEPGSITYKGFNFNISQDYEEMVDTNPMSAEAMITYF